jgi:hypothetical protein
MSVQKPALFCWHCFRLQVMEETESNVFKCSVCGFIRDLTDPDELGLEDK